MIELLLFLYLTRAIAVTIADAVASWAKG